MEAGEILIQSGLLSRQQLERSRTQANGHCDGLRLIESAVNLGFVSEEAALKAVGTAVGLEYIDLAEANVDLSLLKIFPQKLIHRQSLFPIERNNGQLVVATSDPFDLYPLDEVSAAPADSVDLCPVVEVGAATGLSVLPVLAGRADILKLIKRHLGVGSETVD